MLPNPRAKFPQRLLKGPESSPSKRLRTLCSPRRTHWPVLGLKQKSLLSKRRLKKVDRVRKNQRKSLWRRNKRWTVNLKIFLILTWTKSSRLIQNTSLYRSRISSFKSCWLNEIRQFESLNKKIIILSFNWLNSRTKTDSLRLRTRRLIWATAKAHFSALMAPRNSW